jgi:hypothetical protein
MLDRSGGVDMGTVMSARMRMIVFGLPLAGVRHTGLIRTCEPQARATRLKLLLMPVATLDPMTVASWVSEARSASSIGDTAYSFAPGSP